MTEKLLRVNVAAKRLGVSTKTVYRNIKAGKILVHNIGTITRPIYRLSEKSIEKYLDEKNSGQQRTQGVDELR